MLHHVFGRPAGRRTLDVDFGVAVQDWPGFQILKNELIEKAGFATVAKFAHRVLYPADDSSST